MRVTIEKLAPTGEGITRTSDGVGSSRARFLAKKSRPRFASSRKLLEGRDSGDPSPLTATPLGAARFLCGLRLGLFRTGRRSPGQALSLLGDDAADRSQPPEVFGRCRSRHLRRGTACAAGSTSLARAATRFSDISLAVASGRAPDRLRSALQADSDLLPRIREAIASSGARVAEVSLLETPDSQRRLGRFLLDGNAAAAPRLNAAMTSVLEGVRIVEGEQLLQQEENQG